MIYNTYNEKQKEIKVNLNHPVSEILKILEAYNHKVEEVDLFGAPGECYPSFLGTQQEILTTVKKHGFSTYAEFEEELAKRVSSKWVHYNLANLGQIDLIEF